MAYHRGFKKSFSKAGRRGRGSMRTQRRHGSFKRKRGRGKSLRSYTMARGGIRL